MEKPKKLYRQIGIVVLLVLLALSSMGGEALSQGENALAPDNMALGDESFLPMSNPGSPAGALPLAGSGPWPASYPLTACEGRRGDAVLPATGTTLPSSPRKVGVESHRVVGLVPFLGVGWSIVDIAANPSTGLLYTANGDTGDVSILSGTQVITMVNVEDVPRTVVANPDTGLVYVSSSPNFYLTILSGTEVITTTAFGCKAEAMEVHPINHRVYTADGECHRVSILSGTEVLAQVTVTGTPQALAAHPSTGLVYVVAPDSPEVTILSGTSVLTTTYVGGIPSDVDVDSESGWAYVANLDGGAGLAVLSGTEVLTTIALGTGSRHVRADPAVGLVYTSNPTGTVSVIAGTVLTATLNISLPGRIEVEPAGGLVYLESGDGVTIISRTEVISRVLSSVQDIGMNPATGLVYVAEQFGIFVLSGTEKVASIPPFPTPWELMVHPQSGLVYDSWDEVGLLVIRGTEVVAHPIQNPTRGGIINPATGLVYAESEGTVVVLSGTTVVATPTIPSGIYGFACNPSTGLVYGTLHDIDQVVILSGTEVITTVAVGNAPYAVDVNPNTGLAYVLNSLDRSVSIFSGTAPIATVQFPMSVSPLVDVVANPATGLVYVSASDNLWVLSGTEVLTDGIGVQSPGNMVINPATDLVYVESANKSIVILRGTEIVAEVELGRVDALLAAHPTLPYVYAARWYQDVYLLFVLLGTTLVETIPMDHLSYDAVVNPVNGYIYVAQPRDHNLVVLEITLPYRFYLPLLSKGFPENPPGMHSPRMVYDAERGVLVLLKGGGWDFGWPFWEYDGSFWRPLSPAHTPALSWGHVMVYDQARRRVIAGGMRDDYIDETWEYDGSDWHLITPTHSPSARSGHAMVYDAGRKVSVLFGGVGSNGYLNDTWEYDGSDWHLVTPTLSPAPRSDHALVYDAGRGVIVLFGGHDQVAGHYFADTWEYDGTTWRHVAGPMALGSKRR